MFNKSARLNWRQKNERRWVAQFKINRVTYDFIFDMRERFYDDKVVKIAIMSYGYKDGVKFIQDPTGHGHALKIYASMYKALQYFMENNTDAEFILFGSENDKQEKMQRRALNRYLPEGWIMEPDDLTNDIVLRRV